MPRRVRATGIETRAARLRLAPSRKAYHWILVSPGVSAGYRRNRGPGVWVMRASDGKGGYAEKTIGAADDFEEADGDRILTFFQMVDRARHLAKGDSGGVPERPTTVADALEDYARDLAVRGAGAENAGRIRKHLTPQLAAKPVGLLTARDLSQWRDGLLKAGMPPATVVRLGRAVKAMFNLAAARDRRVENRNAWVNGLSGISEDFDSRNLQRLEND
jgi:hypothetical protein